MANTYLDVVNAVKEYYGSGSDQWVEIAKYGVRPDNIDIVKQVPGVNVYTYLDGSIANITYDKPLTTSVINVAEEVNSNVQSGTFSQLNSFNTPVPVTSEVVQETGNYAMQSGSKAVSSGASVATVARTVSTGIAAISAGCRLGKFFAEQTYAQNPDFWDEQLPTMNPETWASIAGDNELGQKVMQFLFGIDPNTNETTAYMDENAFAYMAYAMAQLGMFNTAGIDNPIDPYAVGTPYVIRPSISIRQWCGLNEPYLASTDKQYFNIMMNAFINAGIDVDSLDWNILIRNYSSNNNVSCYVFPANTSYTPTTKTAYNTYTSYTPFISVRGGLFGRAGANVNVVQNATSYVATGTYSQRYPFIINNFSLNVVEPVPGVSDQPGYVQPDTSSWTDPETTKQSLQQQYPDLWNGSIYNDVPQSDGTVKRMTYVPTPVTPTTSKNDRKPTNETVTKNQITINPDTSTDDLLKTIVRYITDSRSDTPSDTPTIQDDPVVNPPDTGEGDSPVIVLPTGEASALWSIYNPSQAQLDSFGAWLWSSNFFSQLKKLFNDPMQAIIGVHKVFATPIISGQATIKCGYIDSEVPSNLVANQYTTVNCGTVSLREYFGNVFDYSPFTEIKLFLPFIGIVSLDTAYVMRGSITITYHVDVITGACLAEVSIRRDSAGGIIYTFGGSCIVQYPVSSGSYMSVISGVIGTVASGVMAGVGIATGNVIGATYGISGAAQGILNTHTTVQHSGGFTGSTGAMGGKKPYLIISRPQTQLNGHEPHMSGLPSNDYITLSSRSGFVKCKHVHVTNIDNATATEKDEIERLLKEGVII